MCLRAFVAVVPFSTWLSGHPIPFQGRKVAEMIWGGDRIQIFVFDVIMQQIYLIKE